MDFEEFLKWYGIQLYQISDSRAVAIKGKDEAKLLESEERQVQTIFKMFDKDEDGYLDFKEFGALVYATNPPKFDWGRHSYKKVCRSLDVDTSFGLDVKALGLLYSQQPEQLERDFQQFAVTEQYDPPVKYKILKTKGLKVRSGYRQTSETV